MFIRWCEYKLFLRCNICNIYGQFVFCPIISSWTKGTDCELPPSIEVLVWEWRTKKKYARVVWEWKKKKKVCMRVPCWLAACPRALHLPIPPSTRTSGWWSQCLVLQMRPPTPAALPSPPPLYALCLCALKKLQLCALVLAWRGRNPTESNARGWFDCVVLALSQLTFPEGDASILNRRGFPVWQ